MVVEVMNLALPYPVASVMNYVVQFDEIVGEEVVVVVDGDE